MCHADLCLLRHIIPASHCFSTISLLAAIQSLATTAMSFLSTSIARIHWLTAPASSLTCSRNRLIFLSRLCSSLEWAMCTWVGGWPQVILEASSQSLRSAGTKQALQEIRIENADSPLPLNRLDDDRRDCLLVENSLEIGKISLTNRDPARQGPEGRAIGGAIGRGK